MDFTLLSFYYPTDSIPKLNTLVDETLLRIALTEKLKYIYVDPLPKQRRILQNYYDYKETTSHQSSSFKYPCPVLLMKPVPNFLIKQIKQKQQIKKTKCRKSSTQKRKQTKEQRSSKQTTRQKNTNHNH